MTIRPSAPHAGLSEEELKEFTMAVRFPSSGVRHTIGKDLTKAEMAALALAWQEFLDQSVPRALNWLRERGEPITAGHVAQLVFWHGRYGGPAALRDLVLADAVSDEVLRATIVGVWDAAELPEVLIARQFWLDCFIRVGYTVDGRAADRPALPSRLFRGCEPDAVLRMAWTPDPVTAIWFADRHKSMGRRSGVYVAEVPPWRMLAYITGTTEFFRPEPEIIVDPRLLRYREAGRADMPPEPELHSPDH